MVEGEIIQFIGLKDLEKVDQDMVQKLVTEYHRKVAMPLRNLTSFIVHIKKHKKEGARQKYSLQVRVVAPTAIFETKNSWDWDLASSVHKAFKKLEHEIEHRLHASKQKPESR